jgi:hypothetical protein
LAELRNAEKKRKQQKESKGNKDDHEQEHEEQQHSKAPAKAKQRKPSEPSHEKAVEKKAKTAAKSKPKRKEAENTEVAEGSAKPAAKRKSKKRKAEVEIPPHVLGKKIRKIQKFVALYWDDATTQKATQEIKEDMHSRLRHDQMTSCRLNAYWTTSAVGCTYRALNKDIAHFYFRDTGLSYMTRLAMSLKCAEMFATLVHEVVRTNM